MTTPTITLYPDTLPAKGQANAAFDTNVDNFLTWQTATNGPELAAMITWTVGVRDSVLAAALAGDLPPLTGEALKVPRANAAEDNVEFATVTQAGWDLLDDATVAAQRASLVVAVDSADADLAVDPDGALRRDIAAAQFGAANAPGTKTALNAAGTAPIFAVRAWLNFNGVTGVAINGSGNIASVVRNAVGTYTVTFTTAMEDDDYSINGSISLPGNNDSIFSLGGTSNTPFQAAGSFKVYTLAGGSLRDADNIQITIVR
jgi:hypothetical protein